MNSEHVLNDDGQAGQSQYPDPEISQIRAFPWLWQNNGHDGLGGPRSSYKSPYLPIATNHQVNAEQSSAQNSSQQDPNGILTLDTARDEYASFSARQGNLSREDSEEVDFLQEDSGDDDVGSDADSDYLDLRENIRKFKDDVRKFRESRRSDSSNEEESLLSQNGQSGGVPRSQLESSRRSRGRPRRVRGRRGNYGHRKAAEPTGDIKMRLSQASAAFIAEDYEEAKSVVSEIIRINAETYEAWTLLASIFEEIGEINNAVMALMFSATLRPKDAASWMNVARFCLEETGDLRKEFIPSAMYCYASAIRADPKQCIQARLGRAAIHFERGNTRLAISQYQLVLKSHPYDMGILRLMAEAYIEQNEVETAKDLYKRTIAHFKQSPDISEGVFDWSSVIVYVELFAYLSQYDEAIKELKSVSRWLLGRDTEDYWDAVTNDDREWDADNTRRTECAEFDVNKFPLSAYGAGLPLELHVKLGLYRLRLRHNEEAMRHLNWLASSQVVEYCDLFREVADQLSQTSLHKHALTFYEPLKQVPEHATGSLHLEMGKSYLAEELKQQAEESFLTALQVEDSNIEARVRLAKLYEASGEQEQAFIYVNEVISMSRKPVEKAPRKRPRVVDGPLAEEPSFMPTRTAMSYYKPRRLVDPVERQKEESIRDEHLQHQYYTLNKRHKLMIEGDPRATAEWMGAAKDLIDDFRSIKSFYPWDKYVRFLGYSANSRQHEKTPLDNDLTSMAERLSKNLGADISDKSTGPVVTVPVDYRGISFATWLDIFLEYAICLAKAGTSRESYKICEAAKDAIVYYHSREDMFLIHVCWCACAILTNDEETCVAVARFFMKDYQFTTDSYRMFSAVTRICQSPVSWYSSGPSQKYILRQVKAMDYSLVDKVAREKYYNEKASYTAQDAKGHLIINDDVDIALLMLYGYILYTGTSYSYALNYFFRAHATDPTNPMINMAVGLAYIHYALKRQVENRQHLILQGLTFLFLYYDSRKLSPNVEERLEAHYNMARTYHMLGLSNLAVPYYSLVLEEAKGQDTRVREDIVVEAAYNLQTISAMAGNQELACAVTEEWLVI